jgi:hypothetical protein
MQVLESILTNVLTSEAVTISYIRSCYWTGLDSWGQGRQAGRQAGSHNNIIRPSIQIMLAYIIIIIIIPSLD